MSSTQYALITGASKGIGRSIALELGKRDINLVLIARSEEELRDLVIQLQGLFGIKADYLAIDLSEHGAAQKVFDWCGQQGYSIHILVNNAGYGLWGSFDRLSLVDQVNMLQLNMLTLVKLCHLFLPNLKRQPVAYILNIGSMAAYQAIPTLSLYAASKAFVVLFSRGLRFELKESTVSVTCVCPGAVNTHFIERAGMQAMQAMAEKFGMEPSQLAKSAVKAMFNRKTEVVPGLLNAVSVFFVQLLPKTFMEKIAASLYSRGIL